MEAQAKRNNMQLEISYVECPHCKKWYSTMFSPSHRQFETLRNWSDGSTIHQSLEYSNGLFSKCNECGEFFWFSDSRQIKDYEIGVHGIVSANSAHECRKHITEGDNKIHKDFLEANPTFCDKNTLSHLTYPKLDLPGEFLLDFIEDYILLLEKWNLTIEKEVFLRAELWQLLNDLVRNDNSFISKLFDKRHRLYKKYRTTRRKNLERLLILLPKIEKYESLEISLIEIERELGNFERAKVLIENLDATDKHNFPFFIKESLKLISKKSTSIFELDKI